MRENADQKNYAYGHFWCCTTADWPLIISSSSNTWQKFVWTSEFLQVVNSLSTDTLLHENNTNEI